MKLVENLIRQGYLKTPAVIDAFKTINRTDFLPSNLAENRNELEKLAEYDQALPIGEGQTISQPAVVAFMLELLNIQKGNNVLDIGSGSGWTTALLAQLVGPKGLVIAIERIPELYEFGRKNVGKYNFIKKGIVKMICANGSSGWEDGAPYDRILASASAEQIPIAWIEQLQENGIVVAPVFNSIWCCQKKLGGEILKKEYPGFIFVPLVKNF